MKRTMSILIAAVLVISCEDNTTSPTGPWITLTSSTSSITLREGDFTMISVTASQPYQVHTDLSGDAYCLTYAPRDDASRTSNFFIYGKRAGTAQLKFYCYSVYGSDTLRLPLTVLEQDIRSVELTATQYPAPIDNAWAKLSVTAKDVTGKAYELRQVEWEISDKNAVRIRDIWIDIQPDCLHDQYSESLVYRYSGEGGTADVTAVVNGVRSNTVSVSTK